MRKPFHTRWLAVPWADALAKRLVEFVLALAVLAFLTVWVESLATAAGAASLEDATSKPQVVMALMVGAALFFLRATYRLIVHPIRAARSGSFLHEEDNAGVPAYRGVPEYRGVPPVDHETSNEQPPEGT